MVPDAVMKGGDSQMNGNAEAFELFKIYKNLLDAEFKTEAALAWASKQCERVNRRLQRHGFEIVSKPGELIADKSREPDGTEITLLVRNFVLYLVKLPPENRTPLGIAHATARVFIKNIPEDVSFEGLLEKSINLQTEEEESSSSIWCREWVFTDKDTHAFLTAFQRHWYNIELDARRAEIILPEKERVLSIISSARALAPTSEDLYIFSEFLDREIDCLIQLSPDEELTDCGCEVQEHLEMLEEWEMQNLIRTD